MKDITLNPGGIIGGILGLIIPCSTVAWIAFQDNRPPEGIQHVVLPGVVCGAFAGNSLWSAFFQKTKDHTTKKKYASKSKETGNPFLDV